MSNNVLSGEKLSKIREDLDITQKELACKGITRSTISQIECGAMKLTHYKANLLAKRIKELEYAKNVKLPYDVSAEYLMDKNDSIEEKFNNYLLMIEKQTDICDFENIIKEADTLIKDFDISYEKQLQLYEQAFKFYDENNIEENLEYCIWKMMQIYIIKKDNKNIINMFQRLIYWYYVRGEYLNVIRFKNILETNYNVKRGDKESVFRIFHNVALSYYQLKNYDECLKYLKKIKNMKAAEKYRLNHLETEAAVMVQNKEYETANKLYLEILQKAKDNQIYSDLIANTYSNIANLHYEKKDYVQAEKFINMALQNEISNNYYMVSIYLNAFLIYLELKNTEKIKYYYTLALNNAIKTNNSTVQKRLSDLLLKYYIESSMTDEVMNLSWQLINNININFDISEVLLRAAAFLKRTDILDLYLINKK